MSALYDHRETQRRDWTHASRARVYNSLLGGAHNFAVDRDAAGKLFGLSADAGKIAAANRLFLYRATRYCLARGIEQFLDLGSGIPSSGSVHDVVQLANPEAAVAYVDNEPVVTQHIHDVLGRPPRRIAGICADLRDVEGVLSPDGAGGVLDFTRPVAVFMVMVLHNISRDDDLDAVFAHYREALAPGSHLVLSHLTDEGVPDLAARGAAALAEEERSPITLRSQGELNRMLTGYQLVDPGVVYAPQWRPDTDEVFAGEAHRSLSYAAVGRVCG